MARYDDLKKRGSFDPDLLEPALVERFFEDGTKFVVRRVLRSGDYGSDQVRTVWCRPSWSYDSPQYLDFGMEPYAECSELVTERGQEVLYIQTRRKNSAGVREMLRARIDGGEVFAATSGARIRYEVIGIIPDI